MVSRFLQGQDDDDDDNKNKNNNITDRKLRGRQLQHKVCNILANNSQHTPFQNQSLDTQSRRKTAPRR